MTENKIVRDKMPLVSVVVPIYNVELYLKECVAFRFFPKHIRILK